MASNTSQALTIINTGLKKAVNYMFPVPADGKGAQVFVEQTKSEIKDLSNYITPVQLARLRHDIAMWRAGVMEAEQAYYPQRVRMQRMYLDTVLNGQVRSCMRRRNRLTTLRQYMLSNEGNEEDVELTKQIIAPWFKKLIKYILDSRAYGYNLIKLGDCIDGNFPDLGVVKRWNISPERENVTAYVYSLSGIKFLEPPYCDWHIWVPSENEDGISNCGYGYLYEAAQYEIILRNLLGFNGDFVELFAQPYRVGYTSKKQESERAELERLLKNMGSTGYAVLDPMDEIKFLESKLGGTGFEGYDNLEARCEKKVSKLILGHADALDSTPGKLGSEKGGEESPVSQALSEIQSEDGNFVEEVVNLQVLPKLRNIGFNIPDNYKFKFKNDDEVEEFRRREDASNLETANIAVLMQSAGLAMDAKYFTDRTNIPCTVIPAPATSVGEIEGGE